MTVDDDCVLCHACGTIVITIPLTLTPRLCMPCLVISGVFIVNKPIQVLLVHNRGTCIYIDEVGYDT